MNSPQALSNYVPDRPFLVLSHVQNVSSPELQCCVILYMIPAALIDCTKAASRVAEIKDFF